MNVDKMTLQQAMDYAVTKIVEQGGQCLGKAGCVYGDGKGKHCAVGWLLDHENDELMRFTGIVASLATQKKALVPKVIASNLPAFFTLQLFHDVSSQVDRNFQKTKMSAHNIDTSGPHWQQWVDMGE